MKGKLIITGAIALLVALLLISRAARNAKSDQLQSPYSGVASVSAVTAKAQPFPRIISETGILSGLKESTISAQTGGKVTQVLVGVGDRVRTGDPLIKIDDELFGLDAERAKITFDKAKMDYERLQKLHDQNSASDSDLEGARLGMKGAEVAAKMAEKTYKDATICAPFAGSIAQKFTEVGQMIEHGMPVVQLVDNSQLKLTVQIPEDQIRFIKLGMDAGVYVDAAGDSVVGKVSSIGTKAAMGTRTFPIEIRIQGSENLKSGMFSRATIAAGMIDNTIVLPRVAVIPEAGRTVVYLARDNMASKSFVEVIGTSGDQVAVTGISNGDLVVTIGNQNLSNGTPLTVKMDSGER